jgi:Cu(I)/Ag(I) efflux system protein CusF
MSKLLSAVMGVFFAVQVGIATSVYAAEPAVDGEVTKINESAGKITIKHGPIPNLDMDSMTMVFRVMEPDMLKQVKVGDKIKFDADRVNGAITITHMEASQ